MKKPNIWIFSLEPLDTRYTCEWFTHVPELFNNALGEKFNIVQINGIQKNTAVTKGAFLNFSDTNYWKSSQLCEFLNRHNNGETTNDDHILFTDAWNPTIIQVKYMAALMGLNWKLHGLWHAGNYDKFDFLGRLEGNTEWAANTERSLFESLDYNYFATQFHVQMFKEALYPDVTLLSSKIKLTGWPMEYMKQTMEIHTHTPKDDLIVFPHRIATEKQVEIFRDLANSMPQYHWIVCQDQHLTKHQYHQILSKAKIVFSANLQETLGISTCIEGPLLHTIPLAPNRLSYTEIFSNCPDMLYPSEWTESWEQYVAHKQELCSKITHVMQNYAAYADKLNSAIDHISSTYFTATSLLENFK